MAASLANGHAARHPVIPDIGRPRMAKAGVQEPDIPSGAWLKFLGEALRRAVATSGLSHKEAAAKVGVDDAELGKQMSGARRVHVDRVLACEDLRELFIEQMALLAGARVTKTIEFERARR